MTLKVPVLFYMGTNKNEMIVLTNKATEILIRVYLDLLPKEKQQSVKSCLDKKVFIFSIGQIHLIQLYQKSTNKRNACFVLFCF